MTALAVGSNVRKERANAVNDSHDIDVEYPSPTVERNIVNATRGTYAGIVANDVDVPECLVRRLGRTLHTGGIGDIARNSAHLTTKIVQALNGSSQCVRLDIGEHHFHAGLQEGASANPIPLAPPVTKAVLPPSSRMISLCRPS